MFRPADITEIPPQKKLVSFDSSTDIRKNPLFDSLISYFDWDPNQTNVGNPFPFVGSDLGGHVGQSIANVPSLARLSIVDTHGGKLADISETMDGTVLGLWLMPAQGDEKGATYEIRSYRSSTNTQDVVTSWNTDSSPDDTVVALGVSPNGEMKIVSATGKVANVQAGHLITPDWFGVKTGLSGEQRLYIDQGDRLWVTDGKQVYVGGEFGFSSMDLVSQLGADARGALLSKATQGMSPAPADQNAENALLQSELQPKNFFSLHAGKTGLTTKTGVFLFPLSTFLKPEWIDSIGSGLAPLAIAPNEDVWGVRLSDNALIQRSSSTINIFASLTAAPRAVRTNGDLFGFYGNRVYAFDYAPTSTFVWYDDGAGWTAQAVSSSAQLPQVPPSKVLIDRNGSLWAMLSDGELLHAEPGK